jgi:hypothetical protein
MNENDPNGYSVPEKAEQADCLFQDTAVTIKLNKKASNSEMNDRRK